MRTVHLYETPPREVIHRRIKNGAPDSRDRLLQLAEKSHRVENRHSTSFSPELRPKMGLRVKDKCRSSMFVSDQSLPDKLAYALRHLRPGAHSSASNGNFKNRNSKGVVAADDVVYIASPEQRTHRQVNSYEMENSHRLSKGYLKGSPNHSELLMPVRDPTLKDLNQIRNLYKSAPDMNTLEDNDLCSRFHDEFEEIATSCSTRSPTDSGYRSTPRHLTEENPYRLPDDNDIGISHKTTTIVHINGGPSKQQQDDRILHVHCPPSGNFEENSLGILNTNALSPINKRDVVSVLQEKRCKKISNLIDVEVLPLIVDLQMKTLTDMVDLLEFICDGLNKITLASVATVAKIIFPLNILCPCLKAANKALSIFALSGPGAFSRSLNQRSGLQYPVGKIYRLLLDKFVNKPVNDTIAIYLTAIVECALEEFLISMVGEDRNNIITVTEFHKHMENYKNMSEYFKHLDPLSKTTYTTNMPISEMLAAVTSIRHKVLAETKDCNLIEDHKKNLIKMSTTAARNLHFFINNNKYYGDNTPVPLSEWTRIMFAFAEHRMAPVVSDNDVQQAARLILGSDCAPPVMEFWRHDISPDCCPQEATRHFCFALIATGVSENVEHATRLMQEKLHGINPFGLTALSESVVRGDEEVMRMLISSGSAVNVGVPRCRQEKTSFLLTEFTGWTPLTWSVSNRNRVTTDILLNSGADLENDTMIKESPLQIAVQTGDRQLISRLLDCGANAFRSTMIYDVSHCNIINIGCPSSLAIAASKGDSMSISLFIDRLTDCLDNVQHKVENFNDFQRLPYTVQLALQEAVYYAVETCRPEQAIHLKQLIYGLNWNIHTWTRALQTAAEVKNEVLLEKLFSDFGPKLASEMNSDNMDFTLTVLFSIMKWESQRSDGNPTSAAFTISRLWHYTGNTKTPSEGLSDSLSKPAHRAMIDASFVNNEHLSDVRFRVDGQTIFGHRIVLFNASDKFKSLLQSPHGIVDVTDVSHTQFLAMMEYLYTGHLPASEVNSLFALIPVSDVYGLPTMKKEIAKTLSNSITTNNVGDVYQFAIVHTLPKLKESCERFLLEHLGSLVTQPRVRELISSTSTDVDVCSSLSTMLANAFDNINSCKSTT